MSKIQALAESEALTSVWLDYDPLAPLLPQLLASLYSLEQHLSLDAGFLANDDIIQANLRQIALQSPEKLSDLSFRQHLLQVLKGVKILDPSSECIYGDFSDHFDLYKDNLDTMYRKTRSPRGIRFESIGSDISSLDTLGMASQIYDSDEDSLMDSGVSNDGTLSASELTSHKFELHEMLDLIQIRHQNVSSVFLDIDQKLQTLKSQNSSDLEFLEKLIAHNALMAEKTHDMRQDISEIHVELQKIKRPVDRDPSALVPKTPFHVPLDSAFLDRMQEQTQETEKTEQIEETKQTEDSLFLPKSNTDSEVINSGYSNEDVHNDNDSSSDGPIDFTDQSKDQADLPGQTHFPAYETNALQASTGASALRNPFLIIMILSILVVCGSQAFKPS